MAKPARFAAIGALLLAIAACGDPPQVPRGPAAPAGQPAPAAAQPAAALPATPATPATPAPAGPRATHVVVLVLDGPRWTETWGEPNRQYIPHMAATLAPSGAVWTDFANDGPTYTEAGHAAMTTGFYQEINNRGGELPARPGLLQKVVQAAGGRAEAAWLITSKDKLATLADCTDPAWHGQWACRSDCGIGGRGVGAGYREDPETGDHAIAALTRDRPRYTLINFKQPDAAGHAKNWNGYLQGIRDGDAYVARLWAAIQADPELAATTDLFVTDDHGRHLDGHRDGYVSHGDDCAGCRKIMLFGLGADVPRGAVFTGHRSLVDLAATCARILGVRLDGSPGRVMDELWMK